MRILCSGLKELRSGKTTLALGLIKYFKRRGESVCGFKPKAGNNIWYHWSTVKRALEKGTIHGRDVQKHYDASNGIIPITTLNPIHRLWVPESQNVTWKGIPNFLLDRITLNDKQTLIINSHCKFPVEKHYFEKLLANSKQIKVTNREDLSKISELYEKADEWGLSVVSKRVDHIICESYGDIGLPWIGLNDLDYVFVVKPFKIYIYEGERYLNASKVVSTLSIEQKTEDIIEPIKPIETIAVPPFANNIIHKIAELISPNLDTLF
jgi:predicted P-loop ATPase/GTPase